uniref:Uncharacterized protein n=1 Tax=Euplotes crassus TaxID=5936 RepID=A0A7S3KER7_EUPCR|mmetsp:Transcript_19357/g.19044  ORF Transcript_19357/g.19044 Transcript_19357/m.19044 type:complete len:279 (+) Transcript_19357:278-1114(+)
MINTKFGYSAKKNLNESIKRMNCIQKRSISTKRKHSSKKKGSLGANYYLFPQKMRPIRKKDFKGSSEKNIQSSKHQMRELRRKSKAIGTNNKFHSRNDKVKSCTKDTYGANTYYKNSIYTLQSSHNDHSASLNRSKSKSKSLSTFSVFQCKNLKIYSKDQMKSTRKEFNPDYHQMAARHYIKIELKPPVKKHKDSTTRDAICKLNSQRGKSSDIHQAKYRKNKAEHPTSRKLSIQKRARCETTPLTQDKMKKPYINDNQKISSFSAIFAPCSKDQHLN